MSFYENKLLRRALFKKQAFDIQKVTERLNQIKEEIKTINQKINDIDGDLAYHQSFIDMYQKSSTSLLDRKEILENEKSWLEDAMDSGEENNWTSNLQ